MSTPTPAKLNLGIISKLEHIRGLVDRLKQESGFKTHLLGGNVTSIPPGIDVIIVRTKSCSHTSTDVALAEGRREGGRPVIFENGVERAVTAAIRFRDGEGAVIDAPSNQAVVRTRLSIRDALCQVIEEGGFFFAKMRKDMTEHEAFALLQAMGTIKDEGKARQAMAAIHRAKASSIPSSLTHIRRNKGYVDYKLWFSQGSGATARRSVGRHFFFLSGVKRSHAWHQQLASLVGAGISAHDAQARLHAASLPVLSSADPSLRPSSQAALMDISGDATGEAEDTPTQPGTPAEVYFDSDHESLDGLGWNVVESGEPGGVAARFTTEAEALTFQSGQQDAKDLSDLFQMLKDQMSKMNMKTFESHGVRAEVLTIHVAGPDGVPCGKPGIDPSQVSTKLSDCTCSLCKNTTFFKAASWAFAHIEA